MTSYPHPALSAALASHALPVGGVRSALNDWHGIDIALADGRGTLRFAAETDDAGDPLDMHLLDPAGTLCWTVRFSGGSPPAVLAAAAVAALQASTSSLPCPGDLWRDRRGEEEVTVVERSSQSVHYRWPSGVLASCSLPYFEERFSRT